MYGSAVWSCCSKENLDRILKLQKRAARIILSAEKTTPSKTLFNGLNWIPFTDELFIRRSSIVYKCVKDSYNCPVYINSMLVRNSDIHNRETCFSKINMICPRYNRVTEGGETFAVRTIKDWSTINVKIRNSASLYRFKQTIQGLFRCSKTFLILKYLKQLTLNILVIIIIFHFMYIF
jgi:hypothetical protein